MSESAKRPAKRPATKSSASGSSRSRSAGKKPKKRRHPIRTTLLIVGALLVVVVGTIAAVVFLMPVPTPNDLATSQATIVYWNDGTTELGRLGDSTRRSIPLSEVPIDAQHAVLAAEDRSFYDHGGISPAGIGRAILNNITGGATQGGSTITQQYAKNAYLSQERAFSRKAKEALLAFKLETVVSKDKILEDYLNTIYFGRGAYGIDAAARAYFEVPAKDLTLSQAAVLASIIKSPSGLAPEENHDALKARWKYVLDGMVQQGWITQAQRDAAHFPEISPQQAKNRLGGQVGYLLNAVTDQLVTLGFSDQEIQSGGLRITSTFSESAENAATKAVRKAGPKSGTDGLRIGLAAVQPGTGEVVAMYGGKDYINDQINNATRQFAQAGSTFKPFALAAAFDKSVSLESRWNGSSPQTIKGYTLTNYGDHSYGNISLLTATEHSVNTAYVNLEDSIGVQSVADAALRAGVPESTPGLNLNNLDLTFVLGTASPSGLSMANAYATFANQGLRATATVVKQVKGSNGGLLYDHQPDLSSQFSADTANSVSYALSKVVTNGTGFAALALQRPVAAKTGTTDGNKSAWFVGYTPQLATAVLMAKEDAAGLPVSMSGTGGLGTVTGGSFPAAIWTAFMKAALEGLPTADFPAPPANVRVWQDCPSVMPTDGSAIPAGCPTPTAMEFDPSSMPSAGASDGSAIDGGPAIPGTDTGGGAGTGGTTTGGDTAPTQPAQPTVPGAATGPPVDEGGPR